MANYSFCISRLLVRLVLSVIFVCFFVAKILAHPMPNSVVVLDVQPEKVFVELQLPLRELELAFGNDINKKPLGLVGRLGPELGKYILAHIRPVGTDGAQWKTILNGLVVEQVQQSPSGPYYELVARLTLLPTPGSSTRDFTLNYDVILHQVATHFALVSVRQDWEGGIYGGNPVQLGVIDWDIRNNVIHPFKVSLSGGGAWNGFRQTIILGMHHIAEGTDHLLFLLVLLLAAPLLVKGNGWSTFGGARYSAVRLLKIVTAFTIGHSITLVAGALGWIAVPGQIVEIIIAFSILISSIHALRPIFFGKEAFVAIVFGLVHGMAFASTLVDMNLDTYHLGLSILGFNLGIELMQLLVILLIFPWLMMLSRTRKYNVVRISGALLGGIAATGWMFERITNRPNLITTMTNQVFSYAYWIVAVIAVMALVSLPNIRKSAALSNT